MNARSPTVEDLIRLAREEISQSRMSAAEKALEQVILLNNQMGEAFYLLGQVYTKSGKFKKAILAYKKVLSLDPFFTEAAIALSSLYNDVGKYKEGAEVFEKVQKRLERFAPGYDPRINAKLAVRHHELGLMYSQYERHSEAHHEFLKAYHLDSENSLYVIHVAKSLSKSGERRAAITMLQKALEGNSRNVDVRVQLGILYHSDQKLSEARREWQEALQLDPENRSAQMYLGMCSSGQA